MAKKKKLTKKAVKKKTVKRATISSLLKSGEIKQKDITDAKKKHSGPIADYKDGSLVLKQLTLPAKNAVLVNRGQVESFTYSVPGKTKRIRYVHKFDEPFPTLLSNKQGNQIYFMGGKYNVGKRGIVG